MIRLIFCQNAVGEAANSLIHDKRALASIAVSGVISAATSGASTIASNSARAAIKLSTSKPVMDALATIAVNTVAGAIDAGAKDITTKAIKGEAQDFADTGGKMLTGAKNAALASTLTQGLVAGNTSVGRGLSGSIAPGPVEMVRAPEWADAAGVIGETVIPGLVDIKNALLDQ